MKFIQCKPKLFINFIQNKLRIHRLQQKGYQIGNNVIIGSNVIIEGSDVSIGDDVYILDNTTIKGSRIHIGDNVCIFENVFILVKDKLEIDHRSKISRNNIWKAFNINIGNDLWCNENVEIGGGGWENKEANLTIGPYTHIGRDTQINVCKSVKIEGFSGIGIGCKLFTHSAGQGQSILNGYTFAEQPILIKKHVSLYTDVMVAPGSKINEGVTVAAKSFVQGELKPNTFYAGTPVKEKKKILKLNKDNQIEKIIELFKLTRIENKYAYGSYRNNPVVLLLNNESFNIDEGTIVISFESLENSWIKNKKNCFIDLKNYTIGGSQTISSESFRDCLRRHGIILEPINEYEFSKLNPFQLRERGIEI